MEGLKNKLLREQQRLEHIIETTKIRLKEAPEGTLRLSKSHDCIQYYHGTGGSKRGTYIEERKTGKRFTGSIMVKWMTLCMPKTL